MPAVILQTKATTTSTTQGLDSFRFEEVRMEFIALAVDILNRAVDKAAPRILARWRSFLPEKSGALRASARVRPYRSKDGAILVFQFNRYLLGHPRQASLKRRLLMVAFAEIRHQVQLQLRG